MKPDLNQYHVSGATHLLMCAHAYNGRSKHYYDMLCLKLKDLPYARSKVIVFGDRFHKDTHHIKRIRYVKNSFLKGI